MNTTYQPSISVPHEASPSRSSVWKKFINWADQQEEKRFLWLAVGIFGHGCIFTILTLAAIMLAGNNFIYWPFAIAAMGMTLITNLAALPTKITVPVFLLSLVIDVVIIGLCIAHGFDITTTYI